MNHTDVIVVGGGGAGLAAAIEARAAGARVLLLEKNPSPGGSTAWSIGSVTATGTPHQQRAGIVDTPEEHWRDMAGFNGALDNRDNPELRRVLADHIPETFRWLLDQGVRFSGPMPEPPHQKPRMHNVLPNSRSYIVHLSKTARRLGVTVRTGFRVTELVTDNGRVVGVRNAAGEVIKAKAVVLAAGDFTSDPDLKAQHMGPREARIDGVNISATGDGQKLALALGARVVNGDLALGPELRFVPPQKPNWLLRLPPWPLIAEFMAWSLGHMPPALLRPFLMSFVTTALAPSLTLFDAGAILVNSNGERFTDERQNPAFDLPDQPGKIAYIVLDATTARRFTQWPDFVSTAPGVAYAYLPDYRRNRRDIYAQADTLTALAARLGMKAESLAQAGRAIGAGPYVVLGPLRAVFVHAEGGLAVDLDHRVLGLGDVAIPGLFAAGANGQGGLLLKGHGHHLAWAFVSGRRAGRNAAQYAR